MAFPSEQTCPYCGFRHKVVGLNVFSGSWIDKPHEPLVFCTNCDRTFKAVSSDIQAAYEAPDTNA